MHLGCFILGYDRLFWPVGRFCIREKKVLAILQLPLISRCCALCSPVTDIHCYLSEPFFSLLKRRLLRFCSNVTGIVHVWWTFSFVWPFWETCKATFWLSLILSSVLRTRWTNCILWPSLRVQHCERVFVQHHRLGALDVGNRRRGHMGLRVLWPPQPPFAHLFLHPEGLTLTAEEKQKMVQHRDRPLNWLQIEVDWSNIAQWHKQKNIHTIDSWVTQMSFVS